VVDWKNADKRYKAMELFKKWAKSKDKETDNLDLHQVIPMLSGLFSVNENQAELRIV